MSRMIPVNTGNERDDLVVRRGRGDEEEMGASGFLFICKP